MNLECLELGPLDREQVKSPIPNMDCENNHVVNESEFCKNRGKRGYKEQIVKIKPSWDAYFCLMLEYVICVDFILLCSTICKRVLGTCRNFFIIEILWCNTRSILNECGLLFNYKKTITNGFSIIIQFTWEFQMAPMTMFKNLNTDRNSVGNN